MDFAIRAGLMQCLERSDIHMGVVEEFNDSAITKTFGQSWAGVFSRPPSLPRR